MRFAPFIIVRDKKYLVVRLRRDNQNKTNKQKSIRNLLPCHDKNQREWSGIQTHT